VHLFVANCRLVTHRHGMTKQDQVKMNEVIAELVKLCNMARESRDAASAAGWTDLEKAWESQLGAYSNALRFVRDVFES